MAKQKENLIGDLPTNWLILGVILLLIWYSTRNPYWTGFYVVLAVAVIVAYFLGGNKKQQQ